MNTKEYISSGIIESYILGSASPEEAGILECVIKNNAEVKAAFEETQKILEDLAVAQAVTPPSHLKSKIWDNIQKEQMTEIEKSSVSADVSATRSFEEKRTVSNNNWKIISAAASILLLMSIAGNLFWINTQSKSKEQIAKLESEKRLQDITIQKTTEKLNLFSNPDVQIIILKGVEKHSDNKAFVFWNKKTKEVYLNAESLPKAPQGMQYQLWAISDGKPVSAGLYTADKDSKTALSNIQEAQTFAITLEKEGGSDVPTMENMYVIGNI